MYYLKYDFLILDEIRYMINITKCTQIFNTFNHPTTKSYELAYHTDVKHN